MIISLVLGQVPALAQLISRINRTKIMLGFNSSTQPTGLILKTLPTILIYLVRDDYSSLGQASGKPNQNLKIMLSFIFQPNQLT